MRSGHKFKGDGWIMARNRNAMDVVPQNLSTLKRPALQKLCKQLGLKANGKNKDMVRSLEEYREEHSQKVASESDCTMQPLALLESTSEQETIEKCSTREKGEDVPVCEVGRCDEERGEEGETELVERCVMEEEVEVKREGGGRGKGGKEKRRRLMRGRERGRAKLSAEKDILTESLSGPKPPQETDEASSLEECHTQSSVSLDQSLEDRVVSLDTQHDHEKENFPEVERSCPSDLQDEAMNVTVEEMEVEKLPESPKSFSGRQKRRRNTYSVSPPPVSGPSGSQDAGNENLPIVKHQCHKSVREEIGTDIIPSNLERAHSPVRKRKRTHSISPSSSLLMSGGISLDMVAIATVSKTTEEEFNAEEVSDLPTQESVSGESAAEEMMALLDKRVADRKADPSYVSPPSLLSGGVVTGSRIPFSKTMTKFNKAHDKHFNKLQSIVEFSERKKKRAQSMLNVATPAPPAKKQKVVAKTPATSTKPPISVKKSTITKSRVAPKAVQWESSMATNNQPSTAIKKAMGGPAIVRPVIPKPTSATTVKPKLTSVVRFEPNLSTKDTSFDFGKTANVPVVKAPATSESLSSKTLKIASKSGPAIVRPVIPKPTSATTVKPKLTSVVRFEPNLSTKDTSFDFGKTANVPVVKAPATSESLSSKTLKIASKSPFRFCAQTDSPSVHPKKAPKDHRSLYKPHKGRLPGFDFSIY